MGTAPFKLNLGTVDSEEKQLLFLVQIFAVFVKAATMVKSGENQDCVQNVTTTSSIFPCLCKLETNPDFFKTCTV